MSDENCEEQLGVLTHHVESPVAFSTHIGISNTRFQPSQFFEQGMPCLFVHNHARSRRVSLVNQGHGVYGGA